MRLNFTSLWILALGVAIFCVVANIEAPIVADFWQYPWPWFRDFMSQSIYEGGAFGGSDIGVTIAILCFLFWMMRRNSNPVRSNVTQLELKFVWVSSVVSSILTVHSLKWLISRARPKVLFNHELFPDITLTNLSQVTWPGFMPWDGPRGLSWNSFPSGHTASCAILLTLSYVLWPKNRFLSLLVGLIITFFCVGMAVARSMAGMHWLSDSVASYFIIWALIHSVALKMRLHNS